MLGGYSGELNEKQRDMLGRSSRRITELLGLTSDLLDIPRIEAGQIVQEMKEVSLVEVVKGCVDDLSSKATDKGIKVKVELPQSLPISYYEQSDNWNREKTWVVMNLTEQLSSVPEL